MSGASRMSVTGWLFPSPDEPGSSLAKRTQVRLIISLTLANMIGAAVVFAFLGLILPTPDIDDPTATLNVNLAVTGGVLIVMTVIGTLWGHRKMRGVRHWLRSEQPATPAEQLAVLRAPMRIAGVHAALWSLAAVIFGVLNLTYSAELAQRVVTTILLGGLTTCAIAYLVTERMLRPAAARALVERDGDETVTPGVKARALLAWMLGTGIPLIGLILMALSTLIEGDFDTDQLALAALVLSGVAIIVGFYVTALAARGVSDPVREVRNALAKVEKGDLDTRVTVYDGSEMGLLQAGFNRMVAGLRERERINDLFGRHVGEDVAKAALEEDVELGGETREVSVLFVDMVGSTQLASERPPEEVVEVLNAFFEVVVDVVREHGGWVNKFEGDAALVVFGAPVPLDGHADRALAAARTLCERLAEFDRADAGIGVSSGEVVAGNIGEEQRFEYTVIGDPVNEAARLTELAKEDGGALASGAALERAGEEEAGRWELGDAVELRGRSRETRLAKPKG